MELPLPDHNHDNLLYQNQYERVLKDDTQFDRNLLPDILSIGSERPIKPEVDEESNNGPLDFSLHRVQDMLFSTKKSSNNGLPSSSKPRPKLTERETPEQRERRLLKGRERMRNLRANETPEERQVRLIKARQCQQRRRERERIIETPEEREIRLAKARERTRLRREQETQEQRERRLMSTRDRVRLKRRSETPEERQKRLTLQRNRKRERYQQMTPEEKELYRCGEKITRRVKCDPKAEKRQTRGINIKYNSFEDDLDVLLKLQNEAQNIDSEEGSWLAEPEVCLSVGSMENMNNDKSAKEDDAPSSDNQTEQPLPSNANESGASSSIDSTSTSLPQQSPTDDLEEQLSQHISNVAMSLSESTNNVSNKETFSRPPNYKIANDTNCYSSTANAQQSESFNSYQCNNNQSSYMKNDMNTAHSLAANSGFSLYHGDGRSGAAGGSRYPFLLPQQHYNPQRTSNSTHMNNGSYDHQDNNSVNSYGSVSQSANISGPPSGFTQHESPLDLQHQHQQQQQAELYNRFDLNHCR